MKLKLLNEIIGETFQDIGIGDDFWIRPLKVQEIKAKLNKQVHIRLRSLYTAKETVIKTSNRMQKIFASYLSNKGLISRIYSSHFKNLNDNNNRKNQQSGKEMGREPQPFSKE